jgi:hypothetical protein
MVELLVDTTILLAKEIGSVYRDKIAPFIT